LVGPNSYAPAQTKHRIEHRPGGIREWAILHDRNGIVERVAATEETSAIGFILHCAHQITFDDNHVNAPDGFVIARALATMGQDGVFSGEEFRFNEQVTKSGMGRVGLWRVKDYLCITRQLDLAGAGGIVG
jgi:hypothetical protein